jgi:hypothetical protein
MGVGNHFCLIQNFNNGQKRTGEARFISEILHNFPDFNYNIRVKRETNQYNIRVKRETNQYNIRVKRDTNQYNRRISI